MYVHVCDPEIKRVTPLSGKLECRAGTIPIQ